MQNCFLNLSFLIHLDMVGKHAGTFYGISNTAANLSGFLVPLIAGFLIEDAPEEKSSWFWVWMLAVITQFLGCFVFWQFADVKLQDWILEESNPETSDEEPLLD